MMHYREIVAGGNNCASCKRIHYWVKYLKSVGYFVGSHVTDLDHDSGY